MTIVTGRRAVAVAAIDRMALFADCDIRRKAIMWHTAVGPAFTRGNLAAGRAEVTLEAADSGEPALVVRPVADCTRGDILGR